MGTSVSHNEARKGDLCVNDLVCVHVFSFFFPLPLSAHTVYALLKGYQCMSL